MDDLVVMIVSGRCLLVYSLEKSLEQAVGRVRARPGERGKVLLPLSHGLTIGIYFEAGAMHVLLSRKGETPPSAQEARTVLAKWPEPVPTVEWKPGATKHFSFLSATWPAPKPAQQMPLGPAE